MKTCFNQADEDDVGILNDAEEGADRVIEGHQAELKAFGSHSQEHQTLDRAAISRLLADVSIPPRSAAAG